jgi:aspartyl aminopeptidase
VLANELGCAASSIVDFELNVCDTQPSTVAGASEEFIFSGRLDNLAMSFCALKVCVRHVPTCTALPCVCEEALVAEWPFAVQRVLTPRDSPDEPRA